MGFFDGWNSLADTQPVSTTDQLRVHLNFNCIAGVPAQSDLTDALESGVGSDGQPAIGSVTDISRSNVTSILSLTFDNEVIVTFQADHSEAVGDIRMACQAALSTINSNSMIPCNSQSVGAIEKLTPGTGFQAPGVPGSGTLTTVAIAVIAVVLLIIFLEVKPR